MYNSRLQKKITQFLLEAEDDGTPRPPRTNIKSGAFGDIPVFYNDKKPEKLNFQSTLGIAKRRSSGDYEAADKFAQNAFIRRKIKKLKQALDKTRNVDAVAALNQQINDLKDQLTKLAEVNPNVVPPTNAADSAINKEMGNLSNSTASYERDELDDELDAQMASDRSAYDEWEKNTLFAGREEDYAENQKQSAFNKKYYASQNAVESDKIVDDPLLADKLVEYTDIINRLEKISNSEQYTLKNFNSSAKKIEDKELAKYLPLQYESTNIDQFEDIIALLSAMYIKLITTEHNLILQQSDDKSRANKLAQFDKKSESVNNKLIEIMNRIKGMISNKKAASYPDLAKRLATLARYVDKTRNKENMAEKSRFHTYDTISDMSQYWSGESGVKQAIAPMLQQAAWIQHLLRNSVLVDLKSVTFTKFLETIDDVYGIAKGFENSDAVSLQKKLQELQKTVEEEGEITKPKSKSKMSDKVDIDAKLKSNSKYQALLASKKDALVELDELNSVLSVYGGEDAAFMGIDIGQTRNNITHLEKKLSNIQKDITQLELSLMDKQTGGKAKMDSKSKSATKNVKHAISQADVWDKKAYPPKGTPSEFNKFGNIPSEYNPDYFYNNLRPSKSGRDLNPEFADVMDAYYDYGDSEEDYESMDPKTRYLTNLKGKKSIGRNVNPMFIQQLMHDSSSPYRQFNSFLLFDFFNKEKTKDYKGGVYDAIVRWMQNNYNRRFGQTKGDKLFINKVSFYAFGLESTNLEPDEGLFEQLPNKFKDDMMNKQFKKLSGNGKFSDGSDDLLTPPGHVLGGTAFYDDEVAKNEFFTKLTAAATEKSDDMNRRGLKDRSGTIIAAAFRNLYDENVLDYFNDFIDGLGKNKLKVYLERAFRAAEFYHKYGDVIVSPDSAEEE